MKTCFIASVIGTLTPNLITSLAQISRENGAQWQTSKLISLDSQFAALFNVIIELDKLPALKKNLSDQFPSLIFHYCASTNAEQLNTKSIHVSIDCDDRAGLTHDINKLLFNLGISVEHQEHYRYPVASIGNTVFSAQYTLKLPPEVSQADLMQQLETISTNARVNI